MQIKEEKKFIMHFIFFIFLIQKYTHFWWCFFIKIWIFFVDDIEFKFEIENNFN